MALYILLTDLITSMKILMGARPYFTHTGDNKLQVLVRIGLISFARFG